MIRRSLVQIRKCSHKADPSRAFDFIPAKNRDANEILDLCLSGLIRDEPHSRALKLTSENSRGVFEYMGTNNLIGFRLLSIGHRDHALDIEPVPLTEPTDPGPRRLCEILEEAKANFWRLVDPAVSTVIRREITYVIPRHQRKGIANYLLHLGLDFEELRKRGIHGITSEASSLANQKLLAKSGYTCISMPNYKLDMFDGNEGVKVFFKDLRK
ncbi:hypothetical protein NECAME_16115 [Necator americanus]|uniref:N-acetyltransferase domain-containing protein n=1 Tax=Necator americanus TaxID=51031 RepID=W2TXK9_NECAM|nr:hypothetical protein NECAME_16115 [Necator americanus]ETN86800.1 hypothetical protein NECAME_16115 [Necator americanus]